MLNVIIRGYFKFKTKKVDPGHFWPVLNSSVKQAKEYEIFFARSKDRKIRFHIEQLSVSQSREVPIYVA